MRLIIALIASVALFGADDPWAKVKELKTGTELRIFKKGSAQPLLATSDDVTEDKVIVVVKNEQSAIAKDDIDRIDYRPPQKGSRVTRETKTSTGAGDIAKVTGGPEERGPSRASVPGQSYGSSLSIGSKPPFETLYRRGMKTPPPAK
jgi:hypothetical protein